MKIDENDDDDTQKAVKTLAKEVLKIITIGEGPIGDLLLGKLMSACYGYNAAHSNKRKADEMSGGGSEAQT